MSLLDLLVLGEANPDIIVAVGDVTPALDDVERIVDSTDIVLGGSGAIVACGAARLGLRTALVGVVGDDILGRFMHERLAAAGVDVSGLVLSPAISTGVTTVLAGTGGRAMLTAPGAIAQLDASLVPERLLTGARHVHVSSYFLQDRLRPDVPTLFRRARATGASTSLDPNWDPKGVWDGGLVYALAQTDVVFPNLAEARALTGLEAPEDCARRLSSTVRTVVIKLGREGAVVLDGTEAVRLPSPPVHVVDSVGAGDSFVAGFIEGRLRGLTSTQSLAQGIACGSLSTRGRGGTAGQATLGEAVELAGRLLQGE